MLNIFGQIPKTSALLFKACICLYATFPLIVSFCAAEVAKTVETADSETNESTFIFLILSNISLVLILLKNFWLFRIYLSQYGE